jgi:NADH-ubiquinone oxidoreductase chain 4
MYMFNRIVFGGSYSKYFLVNLVDLTYREFWILMTLVSFTVVLGIYPAPIIDGLNYYISGVIYSA